MQLVQKAIENCVAQGNLNNIKSGGVKLSKKGINLKRNLTSCIVSAQMQG